jgi:hypothetical protein
MADYSFNNFQQGVAFLSHFGLRILFTDMVVPIMHKHDLPELFPASYPRHIGHLDEYGSLALCNEQDPIVAAYHGRIKKALKLE